MLAFAPPILGSAPSGPARDETACRLLGDALRRTNLPPKEAAAALGIDAPMLSRWLSGERENPVARLRRLPREVRWELLELWAIEEGLPILTREFWAVVARALHFRPGRARVSFRVGERDVAHVA